MHTLLLTCAGESSRFPNYGPKWTLTHPSGHIMAVEAIRGMHGFGQLIVAIRAEHVGKYRPAEVLQAFQNSRAHSERIRNPYDIEVQVVPNTKTPVETVRAALNQTRFTVNSFTVKDCDNYFLSPVVTHCHNVAVGDLQMPFQGSTHNKSYALLDQDGKVVKLREREVVSRWFCCGAYTWTSVLSFRKHAENYHTHLSDVMSATAIHERVETVEAVNYLDWGTRQDWERFCADYQTLFVDIDGTLLTAGSEYFEPLWHQAKPLVENWKWLANQYHTGKVHVVLTTSRPTKYEDLTRNQLKNLPFHRLLMGLPNARRTLINDYVPGRPATARAILLPRNSEDLGNLSRL